MKKTAFIVGLLFMFFLSFQSLEAQNTHFLSKKEKRHIERLRKEKERSMQRAASRTYMIELLKNKYFTFQADYLITSYGNSLILDPSINFLSVDGNQMILQFGLDGRIGLNGVGGITARGTTLNYSFKPGKNNLTVITDMNLFGPGLPPHINLNVTDDGTGELTIQFGNGNVITMYGQVVSPRKASVFVGQSLF